MGLSQIWLVLGRQPPRTLPVAFVSVLSTQPDRMVNSDPKNSLGRTGLSLSGDKSAQKPPSTNSAAFPSLEGFPAVVNSILHQSDYSTLLTCRQLSTSFRDQADKALFDEIPITDLSKGDIVIKSKGRVLPCFHPDSPEEGKIKTLNASVVTTCTAFSPTRPWRCF